MRGWNRIVLLGMSDLAEIATICALEQGIAIAAVVDANATTDRFVGARVVASIDAVPGGFDALVVTDLEATRETVRAASERIGPDRILVPALLRIHFDRPTESAA